MYFFFFLVLLWCAFFVQSSDQTYRFVFQVLHLFRKHFGSVRWSSAVIFAIVFVVFLIIVKTTGTKRRETRTIYGAMVSLFLSRIDWKITEKAWNFDGILISDYYRRGQISKTFWLFFRLFIGFKLSITNEFEQHCFSRTEMHEKPTQGS